MNNDQQGLRTTGGDICVAQNFLDSAMASTVDECAPGTIPNKVCKSSFVILASAREQMMMYDIFLNLFLENTNKLPLCTFKIEEFMKPYDLDDATYKKISDILLVEMEKGLSKTTNAEAVIKMLPTYVRALPDGSGNFYYSINNLSTVWS